MQNLLYDKDIFAKWTIGGGYFDILWEIQGVAQTTFVSTMCQP